MSRTSTTRIAYRVAEVAAMAGIGRITVRRMIDRGEIPRLTGPGMERLVLIPAWSVDSFSATGDWDHPDFRPVLPSAERSVSADPDDQADAAEVIPLRPDAS